MIKKPHKSIQLLSASPNRLQILECLRKNPCDPRDIADEVPKSRRCIQRDLSKFEDEKWVQKESGAYRLTTYGEAIVAEYADVIDGLSLIHRYELLFRNLPDEDHLPNAEWIRDADVAIADENRPHAPLNQYVDGISECSTETLRCITPVCGQSFSDAHAELLNCGVETELVMDAATIEVARSMGPEEFTNSFHLDTFNLYECKTTVEFGLTLVDDRGFLGAYDDQGQFVACAEFTAADCFDWAVGLYERYLERSDPVES